ncbi:glycosyltransferase [Devosia riboflavina]|uniref:glycosyltransferase n=1 Tax=Devosia riboflavina TaxID=46914 RepID=UPI00068C1C62|nr:glycosyltransferase [Devosia riboflavina]
MRIVHYSTRLGRSAGGLYHSVSGLARAMAGLGAEVIVAGGHENGFADEKQVWGKLPLLTHPLGRSRYGFSLAMQAEMARLKPDILHIHGIWSAGSIHGRFASKETRVIVSPRGMLDPWILARKPWLKRPHATLFERPMLARAHLHALSEHEAATALDYMPALAGRVFTVPNGVEPAPATEPLKRDGALYLGRLHEKKQVLLLIDTWERHAKHMVLTIAGWGDPAYEAEVAARCKNKRRVRFVGALSGEAKARAFSAASFFILPSLSEGLPMAALEALSHGCIPILTEACHLPQLFADDVALRMEPDFSDFSVLLARVEAMGADEKTMRSARARQAARPFFWPDIARSMLDHYARILAEAPR